MRAAHQGVAVAGLPNSQSGGLFSNLMRTASQVSAPSASSGTVPPLATAPPVPIPSGGANRPTPTRTSAPSARPEAAAGLDGWLMDRLFGGNR